MMEPSREPSLKGAHLKEWVLSDNDTISWSMSMSKADEVELLLNLKDYIDQNNLCINSKTFVSGFILVLHEACRSGHINFVRYFFDHHNNQFDVNQLILYHPNFDYDISLKTIRWLCNHRKETLIHAAVQSRSVELLQLLVSHKASVNIPDCCSLTSLLKAVIKGDYDTISYLLSAGCNVNYQDKGGCTALMHMCRTHISPEKIENIMGLLIKAGADPTITDNRGFSVIHEAVYNKNSVVLKLLIKTFKISPFNQGPPQSLFLANQVLDLYSSKPTCPFPTQIITDHPQCPAQLKIDQILLNATYSLYRYCCDYNLHPEQDLHDCVTQFEHAVRLSIKLGVKLENSFKGSNVYRQVMSVTSLETFLKKYIDNTTGNLIEMAYLSLFFRERILGYGDSTLIEFLFMFGKAFSDTNVKCHIEQGLSLWLRATEMLLFRLQQNIYENLKELQKLTESGLEKCCILVRSNTPGSQPLFSNMTLNQSLLLPILQNLIYCNHMANEQFKAKHYHDIISPAGYRYLVRVLQDLYVSNVQVSPLVYDTVLKCSTFCYGFKLSTNLIDILLDESEVSIPFLSLCLKYGGHKVINDIGLFGIRPLYKAKTQDVVNILMINGAHADAVNEDGLYGNPCFMNKTSPLPLKCIASRAIVSHGHFYRSYDIEDNIKEFISMHDPDHTQLKIKEGLRTLH